MKRIFLILTVSASALTASASQSTYISCSNQVNELMALSKEVGRDSEARAAAGLSDSSSNAYLDDLDDQIYKKEIKIVSLRNRFEKCLK